MNTISKIKVSDIPPTTLRLPPDLRDQLLREATINGRSLNQEIMIRLKLSTDPGPGDPGALAMQQELRDLRNQVMHGVESPATQKLSDSERMLLVLFATMPPEKQLSLLTLLRR
ncbi:Arc family DNA-binding protein [Paucibacter sp. Y2R2-4]|uniref:Arc family DNA-binding protein n=1 Tax=Paucibacter sp. Y2R2-4 TaxID=2893553 RepID=UPI0021E495EF|nr:Arc family DNA-binding protein [Paucibacter sp. Y2R2-4]MCV2349325.1 Arc family DNA-binding protein [Paucibacter sp. Y2R2-4]